MTRSGGAREDEVVRWEGGGCGGCGGSGSGSGRESGRGAEGSVVVLVLAVVVVVVVVVAVREGEGRCGVEATGEAGAETGVRRAAIVMGWRRFWRGGEGVVGEEGSGGCCGARRIGGMWQDIVAVVVVAVVVVGVAVAGVVAGVVAVVGIPALAWVGVG